MKSFALSALAVAAVLISPFTVNAQEKAGKKNPVATMVSQLLKQLEKAELTPDQTTKIKEMYTKVATEVTAKRTAGGITPEILKKRSEAGKAAKEAGKKGKDVQAAVDASAALSAEQTKLIADTDLQLNKARVEVGKLLTPEQIAKLPEQAQNSLKERTAGKKGKKK